MWLSVVLIDNTIAIRIRLELYYNCSASSQLAVNVPLCPCQWTLVALSLAIQFKVNQRRLILRSEVMSYFSDYSHLNPKRFLVFVWTKITSNPKGVKKCKQVENQWVEPNESFVIRHRTLAPDHSPDGRVKLWRMLSLRIVSCRSLKQPWISDDDVGRPGSQSHLHIDRSD